MVQYNHYAWRTPLYEDGFYEERGALKASSAAYSDVREQRSISGATKSILQLRSVYISKAANSYYKKLNDYLAPDLLILDELGFKKLPGYSADDFFEVISKRYERTSCILTTNKDFEHWGDVFTDNILSSAILDRLYVTLKWSK